MKHNRLLLLTALCALGSACTPTNSTSGNDTPKDTVAAGKLRGGDCAGVELPAACETDCTSPECYDMVLKQHHITDLSGYQDRLASFEYDLSFKGQLTPRTDCSYKLSLYASKDSTGTWSSVVAVKPGIEAGFRGFPVSLIRAIEQKHNPSAIVFYWLEDSPQCPNSNDLLMAAIKDGQVQDYYDVSNPPDTMVYGAALQTGSVQRSVAAMR